MSRKIIEVMYTTDKPVVVAAASSYEELSDNYDDDFDAEKWEATSIGVVQGEEGLDFYMLGLDGNWTKIDNSEDAQSEQGE